MELLKLGASEKLECTLTAECVPIAILGGSHLRRAWFSASARARADAPSSPMAQCPKHSVSRCREFGNTFAMSFAPALPTPHPPAYRPVKKQFDATDVKLIASAGCNVCVEPSRTECLSTSTLLPGLSRAPPNVPNQSQKTLFPNTCRNIMYSGMLTLPTGSLDEGCALAVSINEDCKQPKTRACGRRISQIRHCILAPVLFPFWGDGGG